MSTTPNLNQVSQTIQMMMDVSVGTDSSLDGLVQILNNLNGTQILDIATSAAQAAASMTALFGVFTIVGPGVVVGTTLIAVTLTITKNLNEEAPPGMLVPPLNLSNT